MARTLNNCSVIKNFKLLGQSKPEQKKWYM